MSVKCVFARRGQSIILPVNPIDELEMNIPGNEGTEEVLGTGEINIPKKRRLATFSIKSLFPGDQNPLVYTTFIENWRNSLEPARFTAVGLGIDLDVRVTNFRYSIKGADVKTYWYTIDLREYRAYGAKEITVPVVDIQNVTQEPPPPRVDNSPPVTRTYTVVSGDNLWAIARKLSGNGANWPELYEANKAVVGNNPSLIYAGQVYNVPAGWQDSVQAPSPQR